MESTRVSKKVDRFEAALLELEAYDCDRITASSSASPQNDGEKERKNNDDDFQCEDMDDFIDKGASETVAVEQREGGVVPFIVDDFRHFRQANHAFRLLENMNDNGDGPIDIYDHSGVRSTVGANTKNVDRIPLAKLGKLKGMSCDGYLIRGFHTWGAASKAIGADIVNLGTATQLLNTPVYPDACVERQKGEDTLTQGMKSLGGELITLVATANAKRIFVRRALVRKIAAEINRGDASIDCVMRTDKRIGFPIRRHPRSPDVFTFNSGGNGTDVATSTLLSCFERAGVTPSDVRVVQRGGSLPIPLQDSEPGSEKEPGILGLHGKKIDEESFRRSPLYGVISGAKAINIDIAYNFATGSNVVLVLGEEGVRDASRDIGTLHAKKGVFVAPMLVVQQALQQQLEFGGFGTDETKDRRNMALFAAADKGEFGGSATVIVENGGKNYSDHWGKDGPLTTSVCFYPDSYVHRMKAAVKGAGGGRAIPVKGKTSNKVGKTLCGNLWNQAEDGAGRPDRLETYRIEATVNCGSFETPLDAINGVLATASLGALDAARSVVFMGAIPAASAYKTAEKIAEVARDSALFARDDKGVITDEAYVALIMLLNALGYSVPGAPSRALLPELLFGREGCIWICRPNYKFTAAAKNLGKSTELVRDTDISEEEKGRVLANASGIVQRPWASEMWFSARIQVEKSTSLVIRSVASMTAEGKHPRTDEGKFAAIIDQDALRLSLVEVQEVLYSSEAALLQMAAEVAGWEQGNPKSKHALTAALAQLEALNLCYPAVEKAKLRIKAAQLEAEKGEAAQVEAGEEERAPDRPGVSAIGGEYPPGGGNVAAEEGGYEADGGGSGAEDAEADGGGSGAGDAEAAPVSHSFIRPFIHSLIHSSTHPSTLATFLSYCLSPLHFMFPPLPTHRPAAPAQQATREAPFPCRVAGGRCGGGGVGGWWERQRQFGQWWERQRQFGTTGGVGHTEGHKQ